MKKGGVRGKQKQEAGCEERTTRRKHCIADGWESKPRRFDANSFRFCEKASSRVGGVFETWRTMMQRELVVGARESEWTRVRFLIVEGGGVVLSL